MSTNIIDTLLARGVRRSVLEKSLNGALVPSLSQDLADLSRRGGVRPEQIAEHPHPLLGSAEREQDIALAIASIGASRVPRQDRICLG